jgi:hypothetical protein
VARVLDIRVRRVVRLERRGLRRARELDRAGACGSAAASGGGTIVTPGSLGGPDSGEATPVEDSLGGGTPSGDGRDGGGQSSPDGPSGDVRGESEAQPPPALGGPRDSAEGTSLWVAAGLMLLAALAGFATPALRDRLRSGGTTASRAG